MLFRSNCETGTTGASRVVTMSGLGLQTHHHVLRDTARNPDTRRPDLHDAWITLLAHAEHGTIGQAKGPELGS